MMGNINYEVFKIKIQLNIFYKRKVKNIFIRLSVLFLFIMSCDKLVHQNPKGLIAPVIPVTDTYHGVEIIDNYRYMENIKSDKVQDWIRSQATHASDILNGLNHKEYFYNRLEEVDKGKPFNIYGLWRMKNGSVFYKKRKSNENQGKLYYRDSWSDAEKLLLDPEAMSEGKEQHYSLEFYRPSPEGNYIVYGLAQGGSEETVIHILDMKTGQDRDGVIDRIETAYNIPQWWNEDGFFYCRRQLLATGTEETEIYKNTVTFYHRLGDPPENDRAIFGRGLSSNATMLDVDFPSINLDNVGDYIIGKVKHGDSGELTIYTVGREQIFDENVPWKLVCDVPDSVVAYTWFDEYIYLFSARDAPRYKVLRTPLKKPDYNNAEVVFGPSDLVYRYATRTKDRLYFSALDGGYNRLIEYNPVTGNSKQLSLPSTESSYIFSSSRHLVDIYISSNSWTHAGKDQLYNHLTGTLEELNLEPSGEFDNPGWLTSERILVKSHDGVEVPLSLIYRKGLKLDGKNPTLLSGYGSYGSVNGVGYYTSRLPWVEKGGVYAIAHVRGGGEFGKQWHLAGRMQNKPNTWKDFISCAEYLIREKYTSRNYLAGQGGSAGGITIGRAITERPDLFQAAIINVGDLDMLRIETTTNGVPNIKEFGTVEDQDGFNGLLAMSSLHHVQDGVDYPAVLLTHGINDPRVAPWTSAKMTARLQAATSGERPILFRVDFGAGHGIGSTKSQRFEQMADQMAFLFWQFDL